MTKISIIIPVYNHLDLTIQCIQSIKKHCKEIPYEIIISDDCSTDETKEYFNCKNEIKYRRNGENRGFAYTSNRGAEIAEGDFLLFLNNDTILIDNILTKFLETYNKFENIGAVGAKLLYEDETIQHAGVLIYPNKNFHHLFKDFPKDYYAADKFRELDVVTGASFFMRKDFFFKIGKFDERFINGFEDVEICYRIRNYGKKIIYNPKIMLFHLEEKTRKRNIKREKYNLKILKNRWEDKIEASFFLLKEGFDFRINDYGFFYLIKKGEFESSFVNEEDRLVEIIRKEPLDFNAYKKLIYLYLEKNELERAIEICKKLINFEPTKENLKLFAKLWRMKNNILGYMRVLNLMEKYEKEREKFFKIALFYSKYYEKEKKYEYARYFKEWLENYGM